MYYFWSPTPSRFTVWICMTGLLSSSVQAPGLKSVCPPKSIHIPAQEGRLGFSAVPQSRGKEQEERKERGKDGRGVEKEKREERLFWAGSQQPDSDQSASRLVPLVQWSRTTGRLPCNWDSSFHTENGTGTPWHRRAQIPPCGFLFKTISNLRTSNYTQTKSSYVK